VPSRGRSEEVLGRDLQPGRQARADRKPRAAGPVFGKWTPARKIRVFEPSVPKVSPPLPGGVYVIDLDGRNLRQSIDRKPARIRGAENFLFAMQILGRWTRLYAALGW